MFIRILILILYAALILPGYSNAESTQENQLLLKPDTTGSTRGGAAATNDPLGGQSVQRVFVDPNTGKLLSAPPAKIPEKALTLSDQERQSISTSDQGLYGVVRPDGSIMVDLRGRFRHFAVTTRGTSDKAKSMCIGNEPTFDAGTGRIVGSEGKLPEHRNQNQ